MFGEGRMAVKYIVAVLFIVCSSQAFAQPQLGQETEDGKAYISSCTVTKMGTYCADNLGRMAYANGFKFGDVDEPSSQVILTFNGKGCSVSIGEHGIWEIHTDRTSDKCTVEVNKK